MSFTTATAPASTGSATVGCGSAFADDDLRPGRDLARSGLMDAMGFDRLAERTMALAQMRKVDDPEAGHDQHLEEFAELFSPFLCDGGTIAGNFGAANPTAGAQHLRQYLNANGATDVRLGVVHGDDVLATARQLDLFLPERGHPMSQETKPIVSAHAYIGADPIVSALQAGARAVIGGRIADPSLFVALLCHRLDWPLDDYAKVATATLAGHLLECGVHVTGGHFADPPVNDIPYEGDFGAPFATVTEDQVTVRKLPGSGGVVDERTVRAQLLYEIHDPSSYLTPDVTADFSDVGIEDSAPDAVTLTGVAGAGPPADLKILVGIDLGYKVTCEIAFGGIDCTRRALLARDAVAARVDHELGDVVDRVRYDVVGVNSLFGPRIGLQFPEPVEVRLRMAAGVSTPQDAQQVVELFWRTAPWRAAGGAPQQSSVQRWIGVTHAMLPRRHVDLAWEIL